MPRKTIMLMAMATAALVLSAPGVATAKFTKHTAAITQQENISFTGLVKWTGEIGGVDCHETHLTATTSGGTTANITSLTATNQTTQCTTTGGLAFCTTHSVTATKLPWVAHTDTKAIKITGTTIDYTFSGAFCPFHALTVKWDITATPDNSHHMTKVTLSGTWEVYNGTNTEFIAHVNAGGEPAVVPSGTYGIT